MDPCEMEDVDLLEPAWQPRFAHPVPDALAEDFRARPVFPDGTHFSLGAYRIEQWLGLVDPDDGETPLMTTVWGYGSSRETATYPGPTFVVHEGKPITVLWYNALVDENGCPVPHLLPVDLSIHRAMCPFECPPRAYPVPTVVHLHGGAVPFLSDGNPDAYFTPYYECRGRLFNPLYLYPNDQGYATLWYHDHCLGFTRLNVYAGLAGFYLIRSEQEKRLIQKRRLPAEEYEQLLLLQDRKFARDGSLFYDFRPPTEGAPCPSVQPEFFGNFMLVNGMIWPFMEVEPRHYRLRFLNGSNARTYRLSFERQDDSLVPFHVIGTEQALLRKPVEVTSIDIASSERYDVVIDFSHLEDEHILLRNGMISDETDPMREIMQIRVVKRLDRRIPDIRLHPVLNPGPPPNVPPEPVAKVRKLLLGEMQDEFGRTRHLLGTVEEGLLAWADPVTEAPRIDTSEIWEIYNATPDMHPIHLHLVTFHIIDRQGFTADQESPGGGLTNIELIDDPRPPADYETGAKDTVMAMPGQVTRIRVKFEKWCGEYVWHCHILEHEDHEMMRPYCVVGPREACGDPSLDLVPPPRACEANEDASEEDE